MNQIKLHEKLQKLIPYVGENIISYPLWEEGVYIPQLNFWQVIESSDGVGRLVSCLTKIFNGSGYEFDYYNRYAKTRVTSVEITIIPKWEYTDDGGYETRKPDWSIEEMIDLAHSAIQAYALTRS